MVMECHARVCAVAINLNHSFIFYAYPASAAAISSLINSALEPIQKLYICTDIARQQNNPMQTKRKLILVSANYSNILKRVA